MRSQTLVPQFLVPALCLAAAVLGAVPAQAADCPESIKDPVQVSITIDFDKGTITVSPDPATIYKDPKTGQASVVCWVVQDVGEKQSVEVEAKADQPDIFSSSKFTMTKTSYYADSGKPSQTGTWSYSVKVFQDGVKDPILTLDPQIVIDTGGP